VSPRKAHDHHAQPGLLRIILDGAAANAIVVLKSPLMMPGKHRRGQGKRDSRLSVLLPGSGPHKFPVRRTGSRDPSYRLQRIYCKWID
jgi:hypothetical protein